MRRRLPGREGGCRVATGERAAGWPPPGPPPYSGGPMAAPLYRVGRFCARHHWIVIVTWVVVAVAVALVARAAGEQTNDNLSLPGTPSTKATNLLQDHLPDQAYGANPIVLQAHSGKLTDSQNSKAVGDAVSSLQKQ